MKTELDDIDYIYLFPRSVTYCDGKLLIELDQAAVSVEKEDVEVAEGQVIKGLRQISVEDDSFGYEIIFKDVVLYLSYGETANNWEKDKIESHGVITKFSQSSLINYAKHETLVYDITPGDLQHYCVKTADEFIHVISRDKPQVRRRNA